MGEVIALPCGGSELIAVEQNGVAWYGCSLRVDGQETYLGAENRAYVLSHLRSVFEPEEPAMTAGIIDGWPVRWVLSLAEVHHSLYVHDGPDGDKILFWQDRDARTAYVSRLSHADLLEWRRVLNGPPRG